MEFNDYDLKQKCRNIEGQSKKKLKLSKRLQEVKEKIVTVAHISELK
jgi:hypothetical protein